MFVKLARRLTAWYVVAATVLVFFVTIGFAVLAMSMYTRIVNEGIDDGVREATASAARAHTRGLSFAAASVAFERNVRRPGVRVFVTQRYTPPKPPATPLPASAPVIGTVIENGIVTQRDMRTVRTEGSRFGLALATAAGAKYVRSDFLGGQMFFVADPEAYQSTALWLIAGIVVVTLMIGVLAWIAGRYITSQALRPLVEVTHALQRFAARDFTPAAIAVGDKSDFGAIALAFNAAAAQVDAAFAEREAAENQMRQFVADAGHELRTPLTIVFGYIELLRRRAEAGDVRAQKIFDAIAAEGARMRTLIDNLVLLARMESAGESLAEPFLLRPLIDEIVDARRVVAPAIRFEVEMDVDATIIGSRDEIYEALANVVDNALKYAPGSPVHLATRLAADGGVEVTVADRGPGIPPEEQAAIFDRFYRGEHRGEIEGSGLGLAIAKRAVERSGGALRLERSSSFGTTFALRLRTDGAPVKKVPVSVT
jgi:signal transduction histidine kinase